MIEKYENIIDNLYYAIRQLNASIQSYNNMKRDLAEIRAKLEKESTSLDNFSRKVGNYYEIDGVSVGQKISANKDDVDAVISYIDGITLGIDGAVATANKQIDDNNGSIWWYKKKIKEEKGE